jgi:nucleotidyltransferase/DNA polymerase involved in DNA repair
MKWTYSMIAPSSPHERAARIACLIIPRFSIDVCLHRHRSLRDKPIAVAQGEQRREIVCASADAVGVRGGMTPKQARAACPNLAVIARDFAAERAAGEELLDALETCSPDVEGAAPGLYFFDASGLPAGEAAALGAAVALAGALGYTGAAAASADGKFAARCAALVAGAGISVVPPGGNAAFLAALPVSLLPLAPGDDERFDLLGLRTLGSIAALPTAPLAARFGERARAYARLARGDDRELLRPRRVQAPYEERIAFDGVVDRLEALFFALRGCIAAVATRLAGAAQVCDRVDIVLELDTSSSAPSAHSAMPAPDGRTARVAAAPSAHSAMPAPGTRRSFGMTKLRRSAPAALAASDAPAIGIAGAAAGAAARHTAGRLTRSGAMDGESDEEAERLSELDASEEASPTCAARTSGAGIAECASGAATAVIAVALAEPTASAATMFDLARIALEARIGQGAVTAVMARVLPCADPPPQMTLFDGASGSRRAALAATLARLQAALDRNAIVTMAPTPARSRLPERMQRAEPVTSPREFDRAASDVRSRPAASEKPAAWAPALRLVDPPKRIEPPAAGAACAGPFRLSECWWERPVERDYYQLASVSDGLLLVFHDLRDGQWYVQGIFD